MKPPTVLTPDEEKQFTTLNYLAFDYIRMEAKKKDQIPPCWLCTSEEAKEEARQAVLQKFSSSMMLGVSEKALDRIIDEGCLRPTIERYAAEWKKWELDLKAARADGNPRAFFAE